MADNERQLTVAFRGVRVPVVDKETRKASEIKVPIGLDVFHPPSKYKPGDQLSKCMRKSHRPVNKAGKCSRCGRLL
jgi:hypothetical protein